MTETHTAGAGAREIQLRKLESMSDMAAGIAHDFNNYLAAIMGNNNVVLRSHPDAGRTRDCILRIDAAANQGLRLSEQLATYSSRIAHNPEPVDPLDLLGQVRKAVEPALQKGVHLAAAVESGCPAFSADARLLQRALENLVANAVDALADLAGEIRLGAGAYQPADGDADNAFFEITHAHWVALSVADHGRGIDPQVRPRIFDPFFSTKIRGLGLGLPEVLGIARVHNGNVIVRSKPGRGTTITILLPAGA